MRLLLTMLLLHSTAAVAEEPAISGREQVVILCYHEVEQTSTSRYTVSRENFIKQLDLIEASGHTVVSLADAVDYIKGKKAQIAPKPVVITVDDGWSCTRTEMYEEFQRRKMPYTVFIYPKAISRGEHSLTWEMAKELAAGGASIESHALTHPFLSRAKNAAVTAGEYDAWLSHELRESKARIETNLASGVRYLAYPFGDFDDEVASSAAAAGYEAALTTNRGANHPGDDPYRLKRYLFHGDTTLEDLARWLGGGAM